MNTQSQQVHYQRSRYSKPSTIAYKKMQGNLKQLSNKLLLEELLVQNKSNALSNAMLIAYMAEVDARKLYFQQGYTSLFAYVTVVLHMSEAQAYKRITAARLSRNYPILLEYIADGKLHLTAINLIAPYLAPKKSKQEAHLHTREKG